MELKRFRRLGKSINEDWALEAINLGDLLSYGNPVTVAIIDSGINIKNKNILSGYNAFDDSNDVRDNLNHGTNIYMLFKKIAPNASIIPIKAKDNGKVTDSSIMLKAMKYASSHNADIINMSMGIDCLVDILSEEIEAALEKGIIIVCSAGNNNNEKMLFPANMPHTISCIARDINNMDASLSNISKDKKSFSAPGIHIKMDDNVYLSGTSYAAIIVTSCIAILKSMDPHLDAKTAVEILRSTAVDGNEYSYGLVQLDPAIKRLKKFL